jgi:diguanylate cyclase (GGDEF)-like protein
VDETKGEIALSHRPRSVLLMLGAVTLLVFPLVPTAGQRDLVQTVVTATALVVAWRHLLERHDLAGRGWGLVVAAVSVLGLSDAMLAAERHVFDFDGHPRPSNVVALVGYALLGIGVVQFERSRSRGRKMPGRMEAAIFAFGAMTPLLVFLIIPVVRADDFSVASKVTTVAYALADLAVMTVIARLLLTTGRQSRSLFYLATALFVSLLGDFWSGITTTQGPASELVWIKMMWLAAFILFAAGVADPSMREFSHGTAFADEASSKRRVWLMGTGQAIPAVTLAVAWFLGGTSYELVIASLGLAVSLLVSFRMTGLLDRISEQSVQLAALARSDDLTGLHNRRSWNHELSRACAAARDQGHALCVALIDLDHFKKYNDTYGHPTGDQLLRECASVWATCLGRRDVLARYGGEEFAVILPDTSLDEALLKVDQMRLATPGGQTFSAGVTSWEPGTDPAEAIAQADAALYRAKRSGRNQVLAAEEVDAGSLPVPLRSLRTVVQPIVRAEDLAVIGYEALSRFEHESDVERVFAEAHEHGYGDLLEITALHRALDLVGRPGGVEVFVNVSERAMRSRRFWESLPVDLTGVVVELHELRDGLDDRTVGLYLDRFRASGARVGLDDLGVDTRDLDRIVALSPDIVKVDRSLVMGCDVNEGQAAVVRMLVDFALQHGAEVCVEGVETPGELATVRAAGVTYVQGYLIGRPQPDWLAAPVVEHGRPAVADPVADPVG